MRAPTAYESASRPAAVLLTALVSAALLILWLGNATNIDLNLADAAYDRLQRGFPLQHTWLAERFNHVILKAVLSGVAALVILLSIWDALRPVRHWEPARRIGLRVVATSAVVVPVVISILKQLSSSHCPWDLQRYGGTEPYIRLLEMMPSGIQAGHCLPGGHASSALWLISLGVFWWPSRPRMALAVGIAMLMFGGAVGWIQQLRGAHFLTHTLWSAWIASALVPIIYIGHIKVLAKAWPFGYSSVPRNTVSTTR